MWSKLRGSRQNPTTLPLPGASYPHAELPSRRRSASYVEAKIACFSRIYCWYSPTCQPSNLDYQPPMTFEANQQSEEAGVWLSG